ncbi:hydantoinase/oxoprolinase family protein [Microtetraspora niveoalba]|uniref:hydantoinase/oxoprolinase family protein n=1 Tax=Microtetraspora niveoalba TaxID=46175 RepID=UPI0008373FE1|nr:hydantoinase/oxoprolinase family protein [Microtetraspora niveoalba]
MSGVRIGVDVGGTFTDVVLMDEKTAELSLTKVPSTPSNPSVGLLNGIDRILANTGHSIEAVRSIVHGTTVVTNLLLERNGSSTALITTRGFRDVLEIGRQRRPKLYDLFQDKPQILVPGRWRWEVSERMAYDGTVVQPLDEQEVVELARRAVSESVESIAVVLLHAYANPDHERRVAEIIKSVSPELHVSLSSEVSPEFREFERTSTTVANAYAMPRVARYMADVRRGLVERGSNVTFHVIQSNGGIATPEVVEGRPITTALSGPSGGVIGSAFTASLAGESELITLDMGGTSCDVSLITGGTPRMTAEGEIDGRPLRVRMVDIHTVGAGGGSIGWVDSGGALRVGPQSAGAMPGPACYGHGGTSATVTDANLLLGRIDPATFLGGRMKLDARAAAAAVDALARELQLDRETVALGVIRIAEASMLNAVRMVSLQRGYDPREFTLMAFGGAGPLHAATMARELGVPKVLVPLGSSALSALGCLVADIRHDFSVTRRFISDDIDLTALNKAYEELEAEGQDALARQAVPVESRVLRRHADMRYVGQAYEITVDLPPERIDDGAYADVLTRFHQEHERAYGHSAPGEPVEIVNVRLTALGPVSPPVVRQTVGHATPDASARLGEREVLFESGVRVTEVWRRELLRGGNVVAGPALIEAEDTSVLVPPGDVARIDEFGNVIIHINAEGELT